MKILTVTHNHPACHPGGTEIFARELAEAYGRVAGVKSVFLAGTGPLQKRRHPGTVFSVHPDHPADHLLHGDHFDRFMLRQNDSGAIYPELALFLETHRFDVVHLHHVLNVGWDFVDAVRRFSPKSRIVMTLHDYYAACHHDGTMLKTDLATLCRHASPSACHGCYPKIGEAAFRQRELEAKLRLGAIDALVSPSEFLKRQMVAWGIADARIRVIRNGRALGARTPVRPLRDAGDRRNRFAVFGNINAVKGTKVALQAAKALADQGFRDFTLAIHGEPRFQTDAVKAEIAELAGAAGSTVRLAGPYASGEVGRLMADVDWAVVPSIWWENAPLTIQEAFHHGRPVICSDIGGMAEAVRDGVDGLHVRAGDPHDLARAMRRAIEEEQLWDRLSAAIRPVRAIEETAREYLALFGAGSRPRRRAQPVDEPSNVTPFVRPKAVKAPTIRLKRRRKTAPARSAR